MQVLETVKLIIQTKSNTLLSNEDNTSASLFKLIAQEILKCSKPSLPPGIPSGVRVGLPKAFTRELALFSELFAGNIRPAKRGVPENKGSPGHTEGASLGEPTLLLSAGRSSLAESRRLGKARGPLTLLLFSSFWLYQKRFAR